jgi:hypothetical protein
MRDMEERRQLYLYTSSSLARLFKKYFLDYLQGNPLPLLENICKAQQVFPEYYDYLLAEEDDPLRVFMEQSNFVTL